ncbi:MAG: FAD-dependent monooxygenase [Proteobacteria bacterium]|nr:FAD-dependent monooxygenase [Pseudomonadota bacterium]
MADSRIVEIILEPEKAGSAEEIRIHALKKAGLEQGEVRVLRRSIDARSRHPRYSLRVAVGDELEKNLSQLEHFKPLPLSGRQVIIVGAGPGGYFAALKLLEQGIQPLILERGKDVNARRKDIKSIYTDGLIDPHSNYCFGEGGAGTYSDGKLYTRSDKRGNVGRVLDILVDHGASPDIKIDAHPHVGSNVLPRVVQKLRESIVNAGGLIRFGAHVDDLNIEGGRIRAVRINGEEWIHGDSVILATGHSARDIYRMLVAKNIAVEAKAFALGVRIEHPQDTIDSIFYKQSPRNPLLPPAEYRINCQVDGRGVYSFCMCPGGFVVPASTAPGELVLNGMSMAGRGAPFANAGLVVEMRLEDMGDPCDPLVALHFQETVEQAMFNAGSGENQSAPAQQVDDFIHGRLSPAIEKSSYVPGLFSAPLNELLPRSVVDRLQKALVIFGQKYKGYDSRFAKIMAVESRTSSPVRIIRDPETLMHPQVQGLFPCGEGAGYAGGIVSAAMDGERVAMAAVKNS